MKVDLFSIGRFTVHTYGVMIAIGVILCVLMGYYRAKRYEMKAESVLDLAILCVVMGFLGAKVFFVILSWKQFLADPLSVLWSSGFVVYGGIIFGVVSALIYCKIKDIRFFKARTRNKSKINPPTNFTCMFLIFPRTGKIIGFQNRQIFNSS